MATPVLTCLQALLALGDLFMSKARVLHPGQEFLFSGFCAAMTVFNFLIIDDKLFFVRTGSGVLTNTQIIDDCSKWLMFASIAMFLRDGLPTSLSLNSPKKEENLIP